MNVHTMQQCLEIKKQVKTYNGINRNIRSKRDYILKSTDWTVTPGCTVDQAQWSAYRQNLRDIPQTYSKSEDINWPTKPSTSGPNS